MANATTSSEILEALEDTMRIARFYMRKSNGYRADEWCDTDVNSHGSKYEKAFDVISKATNASN